VGKTGFLRLISDEKRSVGPNSMQVPAMKLFPVIVCPLIFIGGTMFPAALNVYWLINNSLTLIQVSILKTQRAKDYFGIKHQKPDASVVANLGAIRRGKLNEFQCMFLVKESIDFFTI